MTKTQWRTVIVGLLILTAFPGCERRIIEESSSLSSNPLLEPSASHEAQSSSDPVPFDDPFKDITVSDLPEIPGAVEAAFPSEMFSPHFFWTDSTHLCLFPAESFPEQIDSAQGLALPAENEGPPKFSLIVDIESRELMQAPEYYFSWQNIAYQDNCILLETEGTENITIQKLDNHLNLLSTVSFGSRAEYNDNCAVHLPSETLYYIEQDDPQSPLLWRKRGEQAEIAAELPSLRGGETYGEFQLSPSGEKLYLYRIYNGMRTNCIFIYDLKTQSVLAAATRAGYENYPAGFWMPAGSWMGEQPVFVIEHDYSGRVQALEGMKSTEVLYGIPPESRAELLYNPDEYLCILSGPQTPWDCVGCSTMLSADRRIREDRLFYFDTEKDTYLSYHFDGEKYGLYYPQLSPDYKYLACYLYDHYENGQNTTARLAIVPTDALWKPLDWHQVQEEMKQSKDYILSKEWEN